MIFTVGASSSKRKENYDTDLSVLSVVSIWFTIHTQYSINSSINSLTWSLRKQRCLHEKNRHKHNGPIPHICHFFYTGRIFENQILHPKKRLKAPKTLKMSLKKSNICIFSLNLEKFTPDRNFLHRHCLWCLWQIWGMLWASSLLFLQIVMKSCQKPVFLHYSHQHCERLLLGHLKETQWTKSKISGELKS